MHAQYVLGSYFFKLIFAKAALLVWYFMIGCIILSLFFWHRESERKKVSAAENKIENAKYLFGTKLSDFCFGWNHTTYQWLIWFVFFLPKLVLWNCVNKHFTTPYFGVCISTTSFAYWIYANKTSEIWYTISRASFMVVGNFGPTAVVTACNAVKEKYLTTLPQSRVSTIYLLFANSFH